MRPAFILFILLKICHLTAAEQVQVDAIEEVLAVVGRTPVLMSDVDLAELVALVPAGSAGSRDEYRAQLLDARIRLELQFRDLEDSGILYRLELDVERGHTSLLADTAGEGWLRQQLELHGLSWADLEELSLRLAAATAYTEQRLRPRITISLEDVEAAYHNFADEVRAAGQAVPSLTAVRDDLHRLLVERKLNAEIERWLDQARDRLEVTRFR